MNILMSIRPEHLANIYTEMKTFELRKNKPKIDHNELWSIAIYFYESGSKGSRMITGTANIHNIHRVHEDSNGGMYEAANRQSDCPGPLNPGNTSPTNKINSSSTKF